MNIVDQIMDATQSEGGKVLQALLKDMKLKSYHGLTIHIKSDKDFKFKLHDKKVKGKSGNKVVSNIPVSIDMKIRIEPDINIELGGK